ncbi:MAG: NUDIX domain-containing protein [Gammaproteobacteria bacterium]|nr:NUDIX domain-containing protein [Gammaproteobacteria bacterium]
MELKELITALEARIADPKQGLSEAVFDLVTRLTPMVNVDLLLKDSENRTLLTWREDRFYGLVWHIPGGIIRFKETAAQRINKVAETELGTTVEFNETPLTITEMMNQGRDTRGHFISLLYECRLIGPLAPHLAHESGTPRHGAWAWHDTCPQDLIAPQRVFRKYIEGTAS